jgi:DcmR-like sensory protein
MQSHQDDGEAVATGAGGLSFSHGDHVVLFYRDDDELARWVGEFVLQAGYNGGSAIVITTQAHLRLVEDRLVGAGVDVATARAGGSFLALDATETMRQFVAADWPSPAGFWQAMSPLLRRAAEAGKPVYIFGEMVSLLWDAGQVNAAVELEAMWNELRSQYPMSLFCAYPAQSVHGEQHEDALGELCRAHTTVIGASPR